MYLHDGATEGTDPEGDSTKSLVPQVSRMFILSMR